MPLADLTATAATIQEWAENTGLLKTAKELCRDYIAKNAGTPSLGDFAADEVKISFSRQVLVFRTSSKITSPSIRTELSLMVYKGHAELGKFVLISDLTGKTEYTQADIDGEIARGSRKK
ncbi:MAG: hypothetical protein L0228_02035 [Planctomycetes bacterium]|nr:hypothetical protein [Planctomycetota bacterium]